MSVIKLQQANCMNCYKCVRVCPVKSISVENEQASIMDEKCILCGECSIACHQNAKTVRNDLRKVKNFISSGEKVIASIAPSFVAAFDYDHVGQVVGALKALGFHSVQETAIGALKVSEEYKKLMQEGNMENIITTCCPTVNLLVEKYYPKLIPYMAPVTSPMLAHGRIIKNTHGWENVKVVFIGPCISKKDEAEDQQTQGIIDAVLTFKEIIDFMDENNIAIKDQKVELFDGIEALTTRSYPIPMGVVKSMDFTEENYEYHITGVDGIEQCEDMLDTLEGGTLKGYFIEMNSCLGGCIKGPVMPESKTLYFEKRQQLMEYAREQEGICSGVGCSHIDIDMGKIFVDKSLVDKTPSEEDIREILEKIGKVTKDQELNCGACGYSSCRDKAIAVYQGKAELYMCLPYMRQKAESISNVIIETTPNVILAVDEELKIQELNTAGQNMFCITRQEAIGKRIYEFIDSTDFEYVLETGKPIFNKKVKCPDYGVILSQTIIFVEDQDFMLAIFRDITIEEKQSKQIYRMRKDTIDMAQEVIDKQMRVAQEIASLLGETTAETKVTLTQLKDLILFDGEV